MGKNARKSLYVFLCGWMGIFLFFTIQKAIALIGLLLFQLDYARFNIGLPPEQVHALNVASLVILVFLGGWYGIWLGLSWYSYVYENPEHKGLWHGFIGRFFTHQDPTPKFSPIQVESKPVSTSSKVSVVSEKVKPVSTPQSHGVWELDDLAPISKVIRAQSKATPKKTVTRKRVTKPKISV